MSAIPIAPTDDGFAHIQFEDVKANLEAAGYKVLTARAYLAGQERLRAANARTSLAVEDAESQRKWALSVVASERRLAIRCSYLYGLAKAHGASDDELAGGMEQ